MAGLSNTIIPLVAVFAGAISTIYSRIVLKNQKLDFKVYLPVSFLVSTLLMLPILGFVENFSMQMLDPIPISLMIGLVFSAYMYNFFFFKGFAHERLTEVESFLLLVPFFAIVFAYFIFPSERAVLPIILGVVATIALLWSHIKKGHFTFSKDSKYLTLAVIFLGVEYLFIKQLIEIYNPFTLYFVRTVFLTILFYVLLSPKLKTVEKRSWKYIIISVATFIVQYVGIFTSVKLNGIVVTNLILNLLPVSLFMYAYFIYKDHPGWKKLVASFIILICVIISQIYG